MSSEIKKPEIISDAELESVTGGGIEATGFSKNPHLPAEMNTFTWTVYRAENGDTFFNIANRFQVDFNLLKEMNPQYNRRERKHDDLRVGDIVFIPEKTL